MSNGVFVDCATGEAAVRSLTNEERAALEAAQAPPSLEEVLAGLRAERDRRLRESDWTQLADVPEATREAWQDYRQALRDLPEATKDPTRPLWPVPPT